MLILDNTGNLVKTNYTFTGWNTAANGTGTPYSAGNSFNITADTTLYAQWTINTYTVSYAGNGSDGGAVPSDGNSPYDYNTLVTVLDPGTVSRSGHSFSGWNTVANGTGTPYSAGDSFNITAETILYAQWTKNSFPWWIFWPAIMKSAQDRVENNN